MTTSYNPGVHRFAVFVLCWTVLLLVPVSLLPAVTGLAGARYFFGAVVLGIILVEVCLWAAASKTNYRAKWLMHATVLHLPLLLGLLMYDKFTH